MPKLDKEKDGRGYIETEVRPKSPFEFLQIFVPQAALFLVINVAMKTLSVARKVAGSSA